MTGNHNHLNPETSRVLEETGHMDERRRLETRKNCINQIHFVYHENAIKTIDCLKDIFAQVESNERNNSEITEICSTVAITGGTGTGKTETANEFMRQYPASFTTAREIIPIARAILRDGITGLTGLYYSLLEAIQPSAASPFANKRTRIRIAEVENQLLWALKTAKVRIFIVDEFQHLIGRNQQALVNQLKRTLQYSGVAFIPMGTPVMRQLLELDPQLADRCPIKPYTKFHNWEYGTDFKRFVAGYEQFLPFPEPSRLSTSMIARKIYDKITRFELVRTGELLTYQKFKECVYDNKKRTIQLDPRISTAWNDMVIGDDLHDAALLDEDLKVKIDPEGALVVRTNLRRVTEYLKKIARIANLRKLDYIPEELIDGTPY